MTDLAVLAASALVAWTVHLFMRWQGDRIHAEMVAGVQSVLRSRTPAGSDPHPPNRALPQAHGWGHRARG
jgi:hypothetical protein